MPLLFTRGAHERLIERRIRARDGINALRGRCGPVRAVYDPGAESATNLGDRLRVAFECIDALELRLAALEPKKK